MNFLENHCTFRPFTALLLKKAKPFDCGHLDLNDFFLHDCLNYSDELLGKSYCFTLDSDPSVIICAFTVSNDSIKTYDLPNNRRKTITRNIPRQKNMRNYPAVLIGRLGVNSEYKQKGIGNELMEFIKAWFIDAANKTGCRYIVVDAYNEIAPLKYYENNGFKKIFSSEEQEKEYFELQPTESLKTRLLYFDLIVLRKQ